MAKLGEGDPRWLVQIREDGKNVGGWHWEEGDLTPWAKETLTYRLKSLKLVDSDEVHAYVTKASNFDGDVTVSQRKGRRIYFYDLSIDLEWKGELKDGSLKDCVGKILLSDIEQEKPANEFDFKLSVTGGETDAHRKIKEAVRTEGMKTITAVIEEFAKQLRDRAGIAIENNNKSSKTDDEKSSTSNAMAVDNATTPATTTTTTATSSSAAATSTTSTTSTETPAAASTLVKKSNASVLKQKLEFLCRPSDLLDCFVERPRVVAYTQDSRAIVPVKAGDKFVTYDGAVSGTAVELSPTKIVLMWRLKAWPAGVEARVTLSMRFENSKTMMDFEATGLPAGEKENTAQAWNHFYWTRIRAVFGYQ